MKSSDSSSAVKRRWELETATRQPPASSRAATASLVPGLTILWHPDSRRVGERAALPRLVTGSVDVSRLEPLFSQPRCSQRRPLTDRFISRRPLTLAGGGDGWTIDPGSVRNVELDGEALAARARLPASAEPVIVFGGRVALLLHYLDPTPPAKSEAFSLVGENVSMLRLAEQVDAVADLEDPVLIRGETGTGKELLAASLHRSSGRKGQYVTANMAAIPVQLVSSELFGAVRGAFTGADRARQGLCQNAHGGTLFLDEIGDAPAEVQVALLRAIESGRIRPVGDASERVVDIRWLAATDAELETTVAEGGFRSQLLHRLESFVLRLPPLRQRRDDVGRLFLHFLRLELERLGEAARLDSEEPWVPASLVAQLARLPWPGNVRQLRNVTKQLAVASRGQDELQVANSVSQLWNAEDSSTTRAPMPRGQVPGASIREMDDEAIQQAMVGAAYEVKAAAATLGVSRAALYRRLAKMPGTRRASELTGTMVREALQRNNGKVAAAARELQVSQAALKRRLAQISGST